MTVFNLMGRSNIFTNKTRLFSLSGFFSEFGNLKQERIHVVGHRREVSDEIKVTPELEDRNISWAALSEKDQLVVTNREGSRRCI